MSRSGWIRASWLSAIVFGTSFSTQVTAQEPGWVPVVVARGEYRQKIESTPMEQRPYRPLHFYGNAVRREHYRGNPLPMPRDLVRGAQMLVISPVTPAPTP